MAVSEPLSERLRGAQRRLATGLTLAVLLAFLLQWADGGSPFSTASWTSAFFARVVQLGLIAVIVAVQRVGLLAGIVAGVVFAFLTVLLYEQDMASYFWLGQFFLHALKMIIVPLIFFAMVSGIGSLGDVRRLGRLGKSTVIYFGLTSLVAVVIGTVVVNLVQPGASLALPTAASAAGVAVKTGAGIGDIVLSFVSENIVGSMAEMKMLPIIVFSLVFGAVVTTLGERGRPVMAFCDGANEAMMKIVHVVMLLAPVGVFGLIAGRFGTALAEHGTAAFLSELEGLAWYAFAVVAGLAIHGAIVLPLALKLLTGRSPRAFLKGMAGALLTAFSTASSSATIPLTLEAVEENNGVDKRASQFVIPLGATVNMNGTALYEAVACITIAQAYGMDLSLMQQVVVVLTATLAAIGAAGIPEAGLVTLVMVLQAVGLPTEGIAIILAIDWLLDRFRTTVNVWGDAVGAAVVERRALEPLPAPNGPIVPGVDLVRPHD